MRRNAFRDANNQRDPGILCLHDGVGSKRGRHKDHRGIGAGFL